MRAKTRGLTDGSNVRTGTSDKLFWKQRYLQLIALAGMLYLLIFNYIPMFGLLIGFKKYSISSGIIGMFTSPWVGLKYFIEFVTDISFPMLMRNTLVLSILKLVFTFPAPIILAVAINEVKMRSVKRIVQTSSYLPHFISWVVVVGFISIFCNMNSGIITDILMKTHLVNEPISFLTRPEYFYWVAVLSAIWKDSGWWAIIFLAAISSIDTTLYEASEMDGAGRLRRIWNITLPGIRPTITIVLILALGNLLGGGLSGSNFEQCYLMGNTANAETSDIIQTYVLRVGLSEGRYSYSTAAGLMQSFISVFLVFVSNYFAKKVTGEGLF